MQNKTINVLTSREQQCIISKENDTCTVSGKIKYDKK